MDLQIVVGSGIHREYYSICGSVKIVVDATDGVTIHVQLENGQLVKFAMNAPFVAKVCLKKLILFAYLTRHYLTITHWIHNIFLQSIIFVILFKYKKIVA